MIQYHQSGIKCGDSSQRTYALSAYFNNLRQRILYFNVSRQKSVSLSLSVWLMKILAMLDAVPDISVQSGRTLRLQHSKLLSPNTRNCTRDKIACSRTWNFVVFYLFLLRICLRHNFHMFCMQFSKMKMGSNAVWHFVWPWMAEQENGKRVEGTGWTAWFTRQDLFDICLEGIHYKQSGES